MGWCEAVLTAGLLTTAYLLLFTAACEAPSLQRRQAMKRRFQSNTTAILSAAMLAAFTWATAPASAQNARGSATGPTKNPGYSSRDQFITIEDVAPADNMYPVVQH